jgi:putative ABC transport system permease protein
MLVIRLVRANLRRHRGQWIGLVGFAAVAAFMLHAGLVLLADYPKAFDRQADAAPSPHFAVVESAAAFTPDQLDDLEADERVETLETEPVVFIEAAPPYNGYKLAGTMLFSAIDHPRALDPAIVLDGAEPLDDTTIYLPYSFAAGGGYQIGDQFAVDLGPTRIDLRVAGFTNEIFYGSLFHDWYRFYLTQPTWDRLLGELPEREAVMLSVRLIEGADTDRVYGSYMSEQVYTDPQLVAGAFGATITVEGATLNETRTGRMAFTTITAGVLVLFAGLALVTSLAVIRFRVLATIEESMGDIGALKTLGYTSGQLAAALAVQFALIGAIGAGVGIAGAHATLQPLAAMLAVQSSMPWDAPFVFSAAVITALIVVGAVLIVVGLAARRIGGLAPLRALRSGLAHKTYGPDPFPLNKGKGPLTTALAAKGAFRAVGQLVAVAAILFAVAAMAAFTFDNYHSFGRDRFAYAKALVGEVCDVTVWAAPGTGQQLLEEVRERPGVKQATLYDYRMSVMVGADVAKLVVTDDFTALNADLFHGGTPPAASDEVALSKRLADLLGLGVGDTVELTAGGNAAEYRITGYLRMYADSGFIAATSTTGFTRLNPGYDPTLLYVYLDDPEQSSAFLDQLRAENPEVSGGMDLRSTIEARIGPASGLMVVAVQGVTLIAASLIALVLGLVVGTLLRNRRHDFGVLKAVGHTSGQLVAQVVATIFPAAAIGLGLGVLAGHFGYAPALGMVLGPIGLDGAVTRPPGWLPAVLFIGLAFFAAAMIALLASGIRRLSARELVTE